MTEHTGKTEHEVFTNGTDVEFRKGRHELEPQVENGIDPTNCENEDNILEPEGKPDMETREKHTIAMLSLAQWTSSKVSSDKTSSKNTQFPGIHSLTMSVAKP